MHRDRLFQDPLGAEAGASQDTHDLVDFAFDARVARVFPDMIRRSVPGYETVISIGALMAASHIPAGGRCYDLGCSLGAGSRAVLRCVSQSNVTILAVDASKPMLDQARAINADEMRIDWVVGDIRTIPIERADAVLLNFTLQFLPPEDRLDLLSRIRGGLRETGVLILAEKLDVESSPHGHLLMDTHERWKRANGYTASEVARKRAALERVMLPDSEATHRHRFDAAGFSRVELWFRCLNWAAFTAWP
jgi:tRNA (cmo5U34)-methyltransferase